MQQEMSVETWRVLEGAKRWAKDWNPNFQFIGVSLIYASCGALGSTCSVEVVLKRRRLYYYQVQIIDLLSLVEGENGLGVGRDE